MAADPSSQVFLASCTQGIIIESYQLNIYILDADYETPGGTQNVSMEPTRWGCVVPTSNNHAGILLILTLFIYIKLLIL